MQVQLKLVNLKYYWNKSHIKFGLPLLKNSTIQKINLRCNKIGNGGDALNITNSILQCRIQN